MIPLCSVSDGKNCSQLKSLFLYQLGDRLLTARYKFTNLLEFLIGETVELNDELAVGGRDLSAGVDDLDDVQLLSQAHLCADLPTQVLDVLHLEVETQTSSVPFVWASLPTLKTER